MSALFPEIRQIESPVKRRMLRPLEPDCTQLQFSSLPSEKHLRRIAELLEKRPDVLLRAYGGYDGSITDLDFLRFFRGIRRFDATALRYQAFDNIDGLGYLPDDLVELGIGPMSKSFSLEPLARFTSLQRLFLEGKWRDANVVSGLTALTDLTLRSVPLPDLSVLVPLRKLRSLDIKLGSTRDLRLLPKLAPLDYLELWMIRGLDDISPVGKVSSLQHLFLEDLSRVERLPDLTRMTALRRIEIRNLKRLTDLSPLRDAPALEDLIVTGNHLRIEDIACLEGHPTLRAAVIGLGSKRRNDAAAKLLPLPRPGPFAMR